MLSNVLLKNFYSNIYSVKEGNRSLKRTGNNRHIILPINRYSNFIAGFLNRIKEYKMTAKATAYTSIIFDKLCDPILFITRKFQIKMGSIKTRYSQRYTLLFLELLESKMPPIIAQNRQGITST